MAGGRPTKDVGIGRTVTATYTAITSTARAAVSPAPTTGQKIVVDDLILSSDTALNVTFTVEDANSTGVMKYYMSANSTLQITPRGLFKLGTASKKLNAKTSATGNVTVLALTHSEA